MLLSDAIEGYLLFRSGGQVSEETLRTDKYHLHQFLRWLGDCEIRTITPATVREYMVYHKGRDLSPHTIIRQRAAISTLYNWLIDIGVADKDPTDKVPPPRKPKRLPKGLTDEQIEQLVAAAASSQNPRRDKAIVLFMLDTACRNSEVRGVQMPNIDFSTGRVRVIGKGDKQRDVFLGKRALSATWLYVKQERPEPAKVDSQHLFLTRGSRSHGYPLSRSGMRQIFTRMDVPFRIYPHRLRHVAAVRHLRNGLDLMSLQHLMGHADIQTTRKYLDRLKSEEVGRVARLTSPCDNLRL